MEERERYRELDSATKGALVEYLSVRVTDANRLLPDLHEQLTKLTTQAEFGGLRRQLARFIPDDIGVTTIWPRIRILNNQLAAQHTFLGFVPTLLSDLEIARQWSRVDRVETYLTGQINKGLAQVSVTEFPDILWGLHPELPKTEEALKLMRLSGFFHADEAIGVLWLINPVRAQEFSAKLIKSQQRFSKDMAI